MFADGALNVFLASRNQLRRIVLKELDQSLAWSPKSSSY